MLSSSFALQLLVRATLRPAGRLVALTVLLTAGLRTQVQMPTDVRAEFRNGQTFVTWREISATPTPTLYRVYRSAAPIVRASDIATAELIGEQRAGSYWNARAARPFRLLQSAPPLQQGEGFLVTTPTQARSSYYAVTASWSGLENRSIVTSKGGNSVGPILEAAQAIRPVLQAVNGIAEEYVEFLPDRDNGFVRPHTNRGGRVLNFQVVVDRTKAGPRLVVLVFHSRGGSWKTARIDSWLPPNAIQIAFDDDNDPYLTSMWFGNHEAFPSGPAQGKVHDYSERRVLWTLSQILSDVTLQADPTRIYAYGYSFGAMAALGLGTRYPDVIAAAGGSVPAFGITHPDFSLTQDTAQLFGTQTQNLDSSIGEKIWDVFDYPQQLVKRATSGVAPMHFLVGRADNVTGWSEKPAFMRKSRDERQPMRFYWDVRSHTTSGAWSNVEPALVQEMLEVRLDKPFPVFTSPRIDDRAGDGSRLDGDAIGTIGGYVQVDYASVVETTTKIEFDVQLRNDPTRLDDAKIATALVDCTLRRVSKMPLRSDRVYSVRSFDPVSNALLEERFTVLDSRGLVSIDNFYVTKAKRHVVFEVVAPVTPTPFVGGSMVPGGFLELALLGNPTQSGILFYGLLPGSVATPWGQLGMLDPTVIWGGTLPQAGLVHFGLEIPNDNGLRGLSVYAQALVNLKMTSAAQAQVR
ncbi:MAG: hypothetical protein H6834_03430 [Planctomycetes bacterium]|nr:hypothetical protein [Planctomycetota bacterium]